jgi:hypothetical protein
MSVCSSIKYLAITGSFLAIYMRNGHRKKLPCRKFKARRDYFLEVVALPIANKKSTSVGLPDFG